MAPSLLCLFIIYWPIGTIFWHLGFLLTRCQLDISYDKLRRVLVCMHVAEDAHFREEKHCRFLSIRYRSTVRMHLREINQQAFEHLRTWKRPDWGEKCLQSLNRQPSASGFLRSWCAGCPYYAAVPSPYFLFRSLALFPDNFVNATRIPLHWGFPIFLPLAVKVFSSETRHGLTFWPLHVSKVYGHDSFFAHGI